MDNSIKTYAIILASGSGNRFASDLPKQFIKIGEKTILEHTLEAFEMAPKIDNIILIITPGFKQLAEKIISKNNYTKIIHVKEGGAIRKESSSIAVNLINEKEANILIHDCARPFVSQKIISDCIEALAKYNAVTVAIPSTDTLINVKDNIITNIPSRKDTMRVQTPQCFKLSLIKKAHKLSDDNIEYTDDCSLILQNHLDLIHVIEGEINNIKITYPQDIVIANEILKNKKY